MRYFNLSTRRTSNVFLFLSSIIPLILTVASKQIAFQRVNEVKLEHAAVASFDFNFPETDVALILTTFYPFGQDKVYAIPRLVYNQDNKKGVDLVKLYNGMNDNNNFGENLINYSPKMVNILKNMKKTTFLIVGKHAVLEALKNPSRKIERVFLTEDAKKKIN